MMGQSNWYENAIISLLAIIAVVELTRLFMDYIFWMI